MAFLPPLLPTRLPALPTCLLHTPLTSSSPHFPICLPSRPICPTFSIFFTSIPFSFSSCLFSVSSLILVFDVSVHRLRPRFMILASPLSSFCTCPVLVSRSSFLSLLFSHFTSRPLSSSSSSSFPYSCSYSLLLLLVIVLCPHSVFFVLSLRPPHPVPLSPSSSSLSSSTTFSQPVRRERRS